MDAVEFVAEHGHRFLRLYAFDAETGAWSHRDYQETHAPFSLDAALEATGCDETALPAESRAQLYRRRASQQARAWAERLGEPDARDCAQGRGTVRRAAVLQRRLTRSSQRVAGGKRWCPETTSVAWLPKGEE